MATGGKEGREGKDAGDVRRVLVILLAGLGDGVMSLPAMKNLRAGLPDAHVSLLTYSAVSDLYSKEGIFDEIILLRRDWIGGFVENLRKIFKLRKRRYDLAINLYQIATWRGSLKMFLLIRLICGARALGRDTDGRGWFYDIKLPEKMDRNRLEVDSMVDLIRLVADGDCSAPTIRVEDDEIFKIKSYLQDKGWREDEVLVGIHPGSVRPNRRWPSERYSALIRELSRLYNIRVVLTGSGEERALAQRVAEGSGSGVIVTAGELGVRELVALIKVCRLFVSNDSGPMHVAAAVGTPVVALFGPGDVRKYSPYVPPEMKEVFQGKCDEVPCYRKRCHRKLECQVNVVGEDVLKGAIRLLERHVPELASDAGRRGGRA